MCAEPVLITARCLSLHQEMTLRAMLSLLRSSVQWSYTKEANADVVIVDVDDPEGLKEWAKLANSSKQRVAYGQTLPTAEQALHIPKPLRSAGLLSALEQAAKRALNQVLPSTTAPMGTADIPAALTPNCGAEWIRTRIHQQCLCLRHSSGAQVVIYDNQLYAAEPTPYLSTLLWANSSDIQASYSPSVPSEFLRFEPAALDTLLWCLTLYNSNGRSLAPLEGMVAARLRRWPDCKRLAHEASHLRMAATLVRQAHDVPSLIDTVHCSQSAAMAYLNACYALGYLNVLRTVHTKPQTAPPKPNASGDGLLSRLRRRLGLAEINPSLKLG